MVLATATLTLALVLHDFWYPERIETSDRVSQPLAVTENLTR